MALAELFVDWFESYVRRAVPVFGAPCWDGDLPLGEIFLSALSGKRPERYAEAISSFSNSTSFDIFTCDEETLDHTLAES